MPIPGRRSSAIRRLTFIFTARARLGRVARWGTSRGFGRGPPEGRSAGPFWTGHPDSAICSPRFEAPRRARPIVTTFRLRGRQRAGSCPGKQRRPDAARPEEEDAARRHLPGDEAPRALREAVREEGPRESRGGAPRPQADPQEAAARGPPALQTPSAGRPGSATLRALLPVRLYREVGLRERDPMRSILDGAAAAGRC